MNTQSTRALVIAGLSGGSGKSVASVGLLAALKARGLQVQPFKKGPDYIDAGWLAQAAGRPCYNLDAYLAGPEQVQATFYGRLAGADLALVEGNRGLFDGVDAAGSSSTAELAILLQLPVLLMMNCTKATRTMAALALGCRHFEPRLKLAGVLLNQVANARQEKVIREALAGIYMPVLGVMPKLGRDIFPMRHLGVTPHQEYAGAEQAVRHLGGLAARHFDLDAILALTQPTAPAPAAAAAVPGAAAGLKIGVLRDAAFQFYYEENLEALRAGGAELAAINALTAPALPSGLHALYIGGGFPETSAQALAENTAFLASLRAAIEAGLPVYAECGGLIYLGRSLLLDGREYPLAGVFPASFALSKKPQAHGYSRLRVEGQNAFYRTGQLIRGHEFRYSTVQDWSGRSAALGMRVERGTGFYAGRDGLVYKNVLALYTHVLASATPEWAAGMLAAAARYAAEKTDR